MSENNKLNVHLALPLQHDVSDYDLSFVDSEGDIMIVNNDYISPIPLVSSYCLVRKPYKIPYDIIKCDDVTDTTVKLNYPYKIIHSNITRQICIGAENLSDSEYKMLQEKYPALTIWNVPIFIDSENRCLYISNDKLLTLYQGGEDCVVNVLSTNYMVIYTEAMDKFSGIIYWYSKKFHILENIYDFCASRSCYYHYDSDSDDDNINTIIFFAFLKKAGKDSFWYYGVFSDYTWRVIKSNPSNDTLSQIAPNDFFSTRNEYKINHISSICTSFDKSNYIIKLHNTSNKCNIVMLDGRLLFKTWLDDFREDFLNDTEVEIVYTDSNGVSRTEYIKNSDFIDAIETHEQWSLQYE